VCTQLYIQARLLIKALGSRKKQKKVKKKIEKDEKKKVNKRGQAAVFETYEDFQLYAWL
tara:strand:+ start:1240 stop:1416 length:177 start_codon:yes stop_codon:yes gene_type:complete